MKLAQIIGVALIALTIGQIHLLLEQQAFAGWARRAVEQAAEATLAADRAADAAERAARNAAEAARVLRGKAAELDSLAFRVDVVEGAVGELEAE